jgi:hypothetical protein
MELKTEFEEFLTGIRPTDAQRQDLQTGHKTLRERLAGDESLAKIIVADFLQGSYRRHTAVRPKGDKRSDVDIIVVTKLHEKEYTPQQAMDQFRLFLEKHYKNKWRFQGRSIGIELSYVDLDLVVTAAPSEAQFGILKSEAVRSDADVVEAPDWRLHASWLAPENRLRADGRELMKEALAQPEWKTEPLRIPDREAERWDDTHPLEQLRWTVARNSAAGGHFVNVVKALKWWRLEKHPEASRPKGFPLERMIADCCPDELGSVAEGVVRTLETMVERYARGKPILPDYGVPQHDVLARITHADFTAFYGHVQGVAVTARKAFEASSRSEACNLWREIFGSKFPKCDDDDGKKARFEEPSGPAIPGTGRFA